MLYAERIKKHYNAVDWIFCDAIFKVKLNAATLALKAIIRV